MDDDNGNVRPFLFMADAHVKSRTWTNNTALHGDAYAALNLIEERMNELPDSRRPDTLVIGGDWFDSNHPSSMDVCRTFEFLRLFKHVYFIRGNHDSVEPSYLWADRNTREHNVASLDIPQEFYISSIKSKITGFSWTPSADDLKKKLSYLADGLGDIMQPGIRRLFVVLHSSFRHLLGFDGSYQMSIEDIDRRFLQFPVTFLVGDIHKRDTRWLSRTCSIHSPGSLYPLSWDRTQEPCFVSLVDPLTGQVDAWGCTDVRSYCGVKFTGMQDLVQTAEGMAEDARANGHLPPYIRVDVSGTEGYDPRCLPDGVVVQAVNSAVSCTTEPSARQDDTTLEDAVREECSADPDVADLAVSLLGAADPMMEIEGWLDFWNVERVR